MFRKKRAGARAAGRLETCVRHAAGLGHSPIAALLSAVGEVMPRLDWRRASALLSHESATQPTARRPPRGPRETGLSGAAGRDVLSNFAGHGTACPGFMKTRCSASAVSTTTARTTERDPQVARSGCVFRQGTRPAFGSAAGVLVTFQLALAGGVSLTVRLMGIRYTSCPSRGQSAALS